METFRWAPVFETGLEMVDRQHHELVDLINRFSTSVEESTAVDPGDVEAVFSELASYAQYHFQEEIRLMKHAAVDARHLKAHGAEHGSFLEQVARIQREAGGDLAAGARPLLSYLTHWLAYHILSMDQAMARQIVAIQGGTDPAAAYFAGQAQADTAQSPLLGALTGLFQLLSERNRQLFEANSSLEMKVSERTQALSDANLALVRTIEQLQAEQAQTLRLSQELAEANVRLENMAMSDLLTGLYNRRYALQRLESELSSARRHGDPLSLVLLDADGFKGVNDTHGHDAGDVLLKTLAASLRQLYRASDVVCRMGGDEFLVICPRSDAESAYLVAERARAAIASMRIAFGEGSWQGSLSAGVAAWGPGLEEAEALIKAADAAMYVAKRQGRNRVVRYGAGQDPGAGKRVS